MRKIIDNRPVEEQKLVGSLMPGDYFIYESDLYVVVDVNLYFNIVTFETLDSYYDEQWVQPVDVEIVITNNS